MDGPRRRHSSGLGVITQKGVHDGAQVVERLTGTRDTNRARRTKDALAWYFTRPRCSQTTPNHIKRTSLHRATTATT